MTQSHRVHSWRAWSVLTGLVLITLVALITVVSVAQAQDFGRIEDTKSNVSYFYHAQPGEATVQVSVWGTIPRPGIYEVSDSTDLDKLITMAGGAPLRVRGPGSKPDRITITLYRQGGDGREKIYESTLDEMISSPPTYPDLRDDDVMIVETFRRRSFGWRDGLQLVSSLGTMTLLILRIIRFD